MAARELGNLRGVMSTRFGVSPDMRRAYHGRGFALDGEALSERDRSRPDIVPTRVRVILMSRIGFFVLASLFGLWALLLRAGSTFQVGIDLVACGYLFSCAFRAYKLYKRVMAPPTPG